MQDLGGPFHLSHEPWCLELLRSLPPSLKVLAIPAQRAWEVPGLDAELGRLSQLQALALAEGHPRDRAPLPPAGSAVWGSLRALICGAKVQLPQARAHRGSSHRCAQSAHGQKWLGIG